MSARIVPFRQREERDIYGFPRFRRTLQLLPPTRRNAPRLGWALIVTLGLGVAAVLYVAVTF